MQTATPSEDDQSEGTRPLPLREMVQQRRKAVLGTAAGVVSILALGGVVTLIQGFAPGDVSGCAPDCATEQQAGPGAAEPRATPTRTATKTPADGDAGRTFAPTVVRQEKRAKPRPTTPAPVPTFPTQVPEPPWHGHWPPGQGRHFW